jgi:hypothetical protein
MFYIPVNEPKDAPGARQVPRWDAIARLQDKCGRQKTSANAAVRPSSFPNPGTVASKRQIYRKRKPLDLVLNCCILSLLGELRQMVASVLSEICLVREDTGGSSVTARWK